MRGRDRNEERVKGEREKCNMDLMEEHRELTVAERKVERVGLNRGDESSGKSEGLHFSFP